MLSRGRPVVVLLVSAALILGGCEESPSLEVAFCDGPTRLLHAPERGSLTTFPDDFFTVEDPSTPTGLRVSMWPGEDVQVSGALEKHAGLLEQLSTLDGFGINADLTLVFSGPLDSATLPAGGAGSGRVDASVVLVDLDAAVPGFVDFDWRLVEEGDGSGTHTLVVSPTGPLRPQTRYGLAVTTRVRDTDGGCVAPSESMRQLLSGTSTEPRLTRVHGRISELVSALEGTGTITGPDELTAAVVFTTQSIWQTSAGIAEQIRQRTYPYSAVGGCVDHGDYRECAGSFEADDFRVDSHHVDDDAPASQTTHHIPIVTYLPATPAGSGPFTTILYAHSLTQDRHQAELVAAFACPLGFAVVAIDAVLHGDHPEQPTDQSDFGRMMAFLGIESNPALPWDGLRLRGNLRQSAYEKLQLLELLRPGVDVDGDTVADVGIDPIGFVGASLGGIMGPEFLTFAPEMGFAVLVVPGARMSWVIQHAPSFEIFVVILQDGELDGEMARVFPLLQAVMDRGDAGSYTRHVLRERLPGFDAAVPHVLMQIAIDDAVVPNRTSQAYAAGLGIPLLGDPLLAMAGVSAGPDLPTAGNLTFDGGGAYPPVTAGLYQYDVVWLGSGPDLEPAGHRNVADNPITVHQSTHFLHTYAQGGVCEVVDPYYELGVK
ncbi:MAG: hypothetical protein ABI333_13045 [bacterium]